MPKPTFKPTAEQEAIVEAARSSKTNLLIEARAGAAKTSTLVLIAEALPSTPILCIAFNKAIAEEMKTRLPRNCEAKTMHSIGYKAWVSVINRKLVLSNNKCSGILRDYIKEVRVEDPEEAEALGEEFSSILEIVRMAKQQGFLPESCLEPDGPFESLFTDEDFYESLPREPTKAEWDAALLVLEKSFASAIGGSIDFDDMVYCPALARSATWPRVPLTLVDEAQDLNALNHLILTKIVRRSRIIAVGDPCQPLGTRVTRVVKKGDRWNEPVLEQVPIEDIQLNDTLLGHNANGSFMFNRRVEGITRKPFKGNLVVAGPTRYTPNHHCYTRFASLSSHWCVYLMKKGDAYRVGKSRMSYGEQGLGPQIRAKAEGADAMWILATYETEEDAYIAEAVIQTEFGLSDLCFIDPLRPWLRSFWHEMRTLNLEERARNCLEAYNREFDYPLWQPGDSIPAKRPFITRACNLLSGGELLPYKGQKCTGKKDWTAFSISYEAYDGDVISFTISDNHLYVADNIVTHNCQAIYGFRGALTNSMTELAETFQMQRLYLTLCFRCPSSIIDFVRWRAPDICAPEWAKPGEIHHPRSFGPADLTPGSAVICRYNAPLFKLAVKLIQDGVSVELSSGDIQKQLEKILKGLGKPEALSGSLFEALASWEKKELDRARDGGKGRIKDLASCCRVILGQGQTLAEALSFLSALFAQTGRVRLMTGHKAKGLEFERVFFLDSHLIDTSDGNEQEKNLKYVIETRSQSELFFIDSKTYEARRAA